METRRILDTFCKAGGAGMGYHLAGFEVIGIDIEPQPHYPFEFHQADALEYIAEHGHEFDAIHASPPCQGYSNTQAIHRYEYTYPHLIEAVRELLKASRKPYVIENVPGAPLDGIALSGLMFGLKVVRDRIFETSFPVLAPPKEKVKVFTNSARGYSAFRNGATHITVAGNNFDPKDGAEAMEINWMTRPELAEAIPPAYTCYIGGWLLNHIENTEGITQ
jgi:DNA (cytosine-5)-methyltransferase 1